MIRGGLQQAKVQGQREGEDTENDEEETTLTETWDWHARANNLLGKGLKKALLKKGKTKTQEELNNILQAAFTAGTKKNEATFGGPVTPGGLLQKARLTGVAAQYKGAKAGLGATHNAHALDKHNPEGESQSMWQWGVVRPEQEGGDNETNTYEGSVPSSSSGGQGSQRKSRPRPPAGHPTESKERDYKAELRDRVTRIFQNKEGCWNKLVEYCGEMAKEWKPEAKYICPWCWQITNSEQAIWGHVTSSTQKVVKDKGHLTQEQYGNLDADYNKPKPGQEAGRHQKKKGQPIKPARRRRAQEDTSPDETLDTKISQLRVLDQAARKGRRSKRIHQK